MRLIIHAGLHKTASTYLQAILHRNMRMLHGAGVYFQPDHEMPANHSTAWHALLGNPIGVREHVRNAMSRGLKTMILSSEDFEMMIFNHPSARLAEDAAREAGATEIEWHFCLRDPGEYFASQYAQMAHHVFVDFVAMFDTVMRNGRFLVLNRPRWQPRAWDHCFDYETHLTAFAEAVSGTLHLHDFRIADPFPGHGILRDAVGRTLPYDLPTRADALNRRSSPEEVEALLATKLDDAAAAAGVSDTTRQFLLGRTRVPPSIVEDCAAAVHRRFAPGMERMIEKYRAPAHR